MQGSADVTVLQVRNFAKRFGRTVAIADASCAIATGEIIALLGPNGAGKTTLLECIAGLTPTDAGELFLNDARATDALRAKTLFYLPDGITPWSAQSARWVRRFIGELVGCDTSISDDVLNTLRIEELRDQRVGTLSKGQRKRLLLAIALLVPRPVIILDEPFDGLDLHMTRATIDLLRRVAASGRALLLSIHAMADAERVADRLVLLNDGRTIGEGTLKTLRVRSGILEGTLEDVFLALG